VDSEEPVAGRYLSAFYFHAPLPRRLRPALIRDQVIQVGEAREKGLLPAVWVMEALHHDQFPLEGVRGLIQQGARHRHPRVGEDRIPACPLLPTSPRESRFSMAYSHP
jgi:hypothetical protein